MLQCILYQSFALGVECRCRLVEYQYWRVLQDGTCYAHTLALTSAQSVASVADIGVISIVAMLDEVVGIGYLCGTLHVLLCGILHSEGDVVVEVVVEEYRLLVDIANEFAQVVYPEVLYVDTVDEHLALLHIVISWDQVYESRLSATTLSHQGDGLTLWYHQIDVLEYPFYRCILNLVAVGVAPCLISEPYVSELYLMLEGW